MKRQLLYILLGFTLSMAFSGCFAGPGVEPPRGVESADEKDQAGAGGSTITTNQVTPGASGSGSQSQSDTGAPTAAATGGTTGAAGGAGGTGVVPPPTMDAAAGDGATTIDGGIVDEGTQRDAEVDDDAGTEQ